MKRISMRERRSIQRYHQEFGGTVRTAYAAFRVVSLVLPIFALLGICLAESFLTTHSGHGSSGHLAMALAAAVPFRSNIHAIRQRKADLEKKARAMLDVCAKEDRNLTEAESAEYEVNLQAMKANEQQLEREEHMLEIERRSGTVVIDPNANAAERAGAAGSTPKFKSLGEQLMAVAKSAQSDGRVTDPRLMAAAASGMSEAVPSDGGFLVQTDFAPEILQRTYATGEILKRVKHLPLSTNANGMKLNAIDEDSRADGSRMGGVVAYWANEADAFTKSQPKFRKLELNLNKLIALVYGTDELLADAAALEAWVMQNLPIELSFRTEDAVFNGTGVGQPFGLLNSQAKIQLATDGAEANHNPSANDILQMWARFWAPGLQNSIANIATSALTPGGNGGQSPVAAWFVDQSILPGLFGLTIGSGGTATLLLYHPPGYYGLPGPYGQMLGLPVIPVEHCAALGTAGDIVLADLSQYLMIDKGAPQAASSIHVKFLTDEMTFRFTYRVDGQPTWKKPLTPKNGGSTLAPFITLAAR